MSNDNRVRRWSVTKVSRDGERWGSLRDGDERVAERVNEDYVDRIAILPQLERVAQLADGLLSALAEFPDDPTAVSENVAVLQDMLLRAGFFTYDAEVQTCPSRMDQWGPWEQKENLDTWEYTGADRTCSFCGSIHPDDFEAFLNRVINEDDDRCRIEISDKPYKIYLDRPEISNAGEGAIKFYKWHIPDDPEYVTRVNKLFIKAQDVSRERFEKMMAELRAQREGGE